MVKHYTFGMLTLSSNHYAVAVETDEMGRFLSGSMPDYAISCFGRQLGYNKREICKLILNA